MRDLNLKLVIALARANNSLFKEIEKSLQVENLTISEFGVLELLFHKGSQPIQQIASKILVTSGTITYVIDKLIDKGLVKRKRCDNDKRVYYIDLTESGMNKINFLFPKHQKHLSSLFESIDEGEKKQLIDSLFLMQNEITKGGNNNE